VVVEKEDETVAGAKKEEDLEKGEVGVEEERKVQSNDVVDDQSFEHQESHLSGFHRLNPTNPLRIVINSSTRVATPSPAQAQRPPHTHTRSTPTPLQVLFFIFLGEWNLCSTQFLLRKFAFFLLKIVMGCLSLQ